MLLAGGFSGVRLVTGDIVRAVSVGSWWLAGICLWWASGRGVGGHFGPKDHVTCSPDATNRSTGGKVGWIELEMPSCPGRL